MSVHVHSYGKATVRAGMQEHGTESGTEHGTEVRCKVRHDERACAHCEGAHCEGTYGIRHNRQVDSFRPSQLSLFVS